MTEQPKKFIMPEIEKAEKKPFPKWIKFTLYLIVFCFVVIGVSATVGFIINHEWRSPIVLRLPYTDPKIISPVSTRSASLIPKAYAEKKEVPLTNKEIILSYFPLSEREAVDTLIQLESSWNQYAQNPISTACGYFQSINCDYDMSNVREQAEWGKNYILKRYGTANNALAYWYAHHSY